MNLREAAQQALEALEASGLSAHKTKQAREAAITALRDALAEPEQEPVAYVTGFSKGYAVVQPVDRSLLMPVGMALYRSPPTYQESRQVEPVAWITPGQELHLVNYEGFQDWIPLYATPPKRKPLTDEAIWLEYQTLWPFCPHEEKRLSADIVRFARTIERAHDIGGEE